MKQETLSVPVLEIRPVTGKTFGFARLADGGRDAFVSPPLMWEVQEKTPPHAIVEMAEKGRRVVRFLEKPETKFVWEGKPDEERMVALIPEIARRWLDFKERISSEICSVSDYGHTEFSRLWSAACAAGEAGKFLGQLDGFLATAKKAAVSAKFHQLFAEWKSALGCQVNLERGMLSVSVHTSKNNPLADQDDLHTPWWLEYVTSEERSKVLAVATPIGEETRRLVGQLMAERKAAEDARPSRENARETAFWRMVIVRTGISGLELEPRADKDWLSPLVAKLGDQKHRFTGDKYDQVRNFADWLKRLGQRRAALRILGKTPHAQYLPYTEEEIEAIIAKEDEEAKWRDLFARATEARLVQMYGSQIGNDGYCVIAGSEVSSSFFKPHTAWDNCSSNKVEELRAYGLYNSVLSWERIETPTCPFAELDRLVHVADMDAVKQDPHRHNPITEPAKEERARLVAEENRLKEEVAAEKLRQLKLREEESRLVAQNAAKEWRNSDISLVQKDWENMLLWSKGSRKYQGLHLDAQKLLEEFREKSERLQEVQKPTERPPTKRVPTVAEQKQRKPEKSDFLSKGTWDALDGLKL